MAKSQAIIKVKGVVNNFKTHWNEPPRGRYIPFKEVFAYGIGGMGVHCATVLTNAIGLSATNLLVGSCIGLKPTHLYIMSIVSSFFGIVITLFRSYFMDNVKSKMGKFRPFLKWMGVPTVLSSILFVWMPYEHMSYNQKATTVLFIFILISIFNPFYVDSYNMLIQVMSPSSEERTDVMSIAQIVFSLAPTVTNFAIPFLAQLTGGLTDIRTYRIVHPIISVIGLLFAFPVYKYTNERIIKPRSKENEVRFFDAIRDIVKNKYFWIINVGAWAGFMEMAYGAILSWTFVYAFPEKEELMGVASTIIGNGALWAMLIAPFLIRKFGKRNLLISCNCINIVLMLMLFFTYHSLLMVIVVYYINNFILVLGNIYNPGINADMRDYQQYISGERIDGMFGVVGLIGTFIGYFTGYVLPYVQERCGLKDNYDVLYDPTIRDNLFRALIICSIIGATLNVIPYFFYDLTEKKHRGITYVLRIRAMFDDYSADCLEDDVLKEAMQIINDVKSVENTAPVPITKDELNLARKMPNNTEEEKTARSNAIKQAKDNMYKLRLKNENIDLAPVVMQELNKFDTPRFIAQVSLANEIYSIENNDLKTALDIVNSRIDSIEKTKDNKELISDLKQKRRDINHAIKLVAKYYSDGIVPFDDERLNAVQEVETSSFKDTVARKLEIRRLTAEKSHYKHAVKPFVDAKRLLVQCEAYNCMDKLVERYNNLVLETAEA